MFQNVKTPLYSVKRPKTQNYHQTAYFSSKNVCLVTQSSPECTTDWQSLAVHSHWDHRSTLGDHISTRADWSILVTWPEYWPLIGQWLRQGWPLGDQLRRVMGWSGDIANQKHWLKGFMLETTIHFWLRLTDKISFSFQTWDSLKDEDWEL